jgi:hypothetical protein
VIGNVKVGRIYGMWQKEREKMNSMEEIENVENDS